MKMIGGLPVKEHTTSELEEENFHVTNLGEKVPGESDLNYGRYQEVQKELARRYGPNLKRVK